MNFSERATYLNFEEKRRVAISRKTAVKCQNADENLLNPENAYIIEGLSLQVIHLCIFFWRCEMYKN